MTQQAPHQRNGEIELARFLVALVIVNYHTIFFPGCAVLFYYGRIGVEFFFLLSGFLMAASLQRKEALSVSSFREVNRETCRFLWRKISAFYPELVISCILGVIFFCCAYYEAPIISWVSKGLRTLTADMFLLGISGFTDGSGFVNRGVNGVSWYLGSMIWSMAILYPLYRWVGLNTILPTISLVLLSAFFAGGELGRVSGVVSLVRSDNIRAFCEIALGASLFPVVMLIRQFDWSWWVRCGLTLVKMAGYGVFFLDAVVRIPPNGGGNGLVLIALLLIIVLSFSHVCLDANLYQNRLIFWLGRFSLPLYLSHMFYAQHLGVLVSDSLSPVSKLLLYNVCSLATAVLVMYSAQFTRRFFKEHRELFLRSSAPAVEK